MDYNSNSYITYTAPAPVNLSNLPAAMSSPVEVQPVGKVGELDDSHLLCIFNQPSSSSASPSETVLQVGDQTRALSAWWCHYQLRNE